MSLFSFLKNKSGSNVPILASSAQTVVAAASQAVASTTQGVANVAHTAASGIQATTSSATNAAHGHGSHAAPWEGVNLWRTPYKGNTDTITHVKRNKGTLDNYVENRIRRIQQLQLFALVNILFNNLP